MTEKSKGHFITSQTYGTRISFVAIVPVITLHLR